MRPGRAGRIGIAAWIAAWSVGLSACHAPEAEPEVVTEAAVCAPAWPEPLEYQEPEAVAAVLEVYPAIAGNLIAWSWEDLIRNRREARPYQSKSKMPNLRDSRRSWRGGCAATLRHERCESRRFGMTPLEGLCQVGGDLAVAGGGAADLRGLESLALVGGMLQLASLPELRSLDALDGLLAARSLRVQSTGLRALAASIIP